MCRLLFSTHLSVNNATSTQSRVVGGSNWRIEFKRQPKWWDGKKTRVYSLTHQLWLAWESSRVRECPPANKICLNPINIHFHRDCFVSRRSSAGAVISIKSPSLNVIDYWPRHNYCGHDDLTASRLHFTLSWLFRFQVHHPRATTHQQYHFQLHCRLSVFFIRESKISRFLINQWIKLFTTKYLVLWFNLSFRFVFTCPYAEGLYWFLFELLALH